MNYRFEHNLSCSKPVLHIESAGHVAHAFLNNIYTGRLLSMHGRSEWIMIRNWNSGNFELQASN